MKITDALLAEHAVFYAQFRHLEEVLPGACSIEEVRAQGALLAAALRGHAALEDELLFDRMEAHSLAQEGPLPVMRREHREIEGSLLRLQETPTLAQAVRLLTHVVEMARDHFAKEEQILFPLAEQMLGPQALEQLGRDWARQRELASP